MLLDNASSLYMQMNSTVSHNQYDAGYHQQTKTISQWFSEEGILVQAFCSSTDD